MKKSKSEIRVLVVGVGGGSHGLEIIKALRLSGIKYYICAADMRKYSLGLFKANKGYVIPPVSDSGYIPTILNICSEEKIDVLIHGSEPDLRMISDKRDIFERKKIFLPFNSKEVINICSDKKQTFEFLRSRNITAPRTIAIANTEDAFRVDFFPVIVKPYLCSGGSNNTFIAQDKKELLFFVSYILKHKGRPIVQEYIGGPEDEYTVGVLSDLEEKIISCVAIRRFILSSLSSRHRIVSLKNKKKILAISTGISQGEIVNNNNLFRQSIDIAKIFCSKGPFNIQCRFIKGKVYPFEINPRFSGTTYIRALAGVNEPDLLIRKYILKEVLPRNITAKTGLALRGLEETFIPMPKREIK